MIKFVSESLLEFYRSEDSDDVKDTLGIGNRRVRDKKRLEKFAEDNGYHFEEDTRRGTLRVTVAMDIEETLDYRSSGDPSAWREDNKFRADAVQYTITYPTDRHGVDWEKEGTPISLRKRWMQGGKGIKQKLMGRFGDIKDAIRRIEQSIPKERSKGI
jgi:hypothetical protein